MLKFQQHSNFRKSIRKIKIVSNFNLIGVFPKKIMHQFDPVKATALHWLGKTKFGSRQRNVRDIEVRDYFKGNKFYIANGPRNLF